MASTQSTATTASTAARTPRRAGQAAGPGLNLLIDQAIQSLPLQVDASLQSLAMRWSYTLRNRQRWVSRGTTTQLQREEVQTLIRKNLGLSDAALLTLVGASVVEVSIPYSGEERGWEWRIFPREYIFASARRTLRKVRDNDFTVVRHLKRRGAGKPSGAKVMLYIESAPTTAIAEAYSFASERAMAEHAARQLSLELKQLINPSIEQLRQVVESLAPQLVHVAGVDNHEARELRERAGEVLKEQAARDGYYMSDGRGGAIEIEADALALALCAAAEKPALVCFNLRNSAPRVAAMCVAQGAGAATGFQDTFDDGLAELFHATLFRAWKFTGGDATSAFRYAWQQLRQTGQRIVGTGLVLWNSRSIHTARLRSPQQISEDWQLASARAVTAETARQDLVVRVEHVPELNYSMLHNDRPLFTEFRIQKTADDIGAVPGIAVRVELHMGHDNLPFQQQVVISSTQPGVDLHEQIRVSLAASLSRAVRETLYTSLLIEVEVLGVTLLRETRRVALLPVDQWEDSDANRKWLPSFVLPRDPAVARVVDQAQRYLQALRDDPTAGFDGYQSVVEDPNDPSGLNTEALDRQVQALWCALLYESPLSYINPPPSFSKFSQRLRTPSDVIDGRRGTCIDLALLLASCLEYVEIHPTIVLLNDHAFPCYWRSELWFDAFALAHLEDPQPGQRDPAGRRGEQAGAGAQQQDSWSFQKKHFREVLAEIEAGRLVPLEATALCWRTSFAEACRQGRRNLSRRSRFHSMLDVRAARIDEHKAVTPLPLYRGEV